MKRNFIGQKDDNGRIPLHLAAKHNSNPEISHLLINKGSRSHMDAQDSNGETPRNLSRNNPNADVAAVFNTP
jgi:ankyrin repeat protein